MPISRTNEAGLRGIANRVAKGQIDGSKLKQNEVKELITEFAKFRSDTQQLNWVRTEFPTLSTWLNEIPDADLARGMRDPVALEKMAEELKNKIETRLEESKWDDVGLNPAYEQRFKMLYPSADHEFLQELPDKRGNPSIRFIMEDKSYRDLVPQDESWLGNVFDGTEKDEVTKRLKQLGVKDVDVGVKEEHGLLGMSLLGTDFLHMPPQDATLLLDDVQLSDRGMALHSDQRWQAVIRTKLPGSDDEQNCFALPAEAFKGIRGIRHGLEENADASAVLQGCLNRLQERGVMAPKAQLVEVNGQQTIAMPTAQARILMTPIAEGDPSCKISLKKMDNYDPSDRGFSTDNGVMMAQESLLSYEDASVIKDFTKVWGFTDTTFIEDPETDAQAFVTFDPNKNSVHVAFRGTESREDAFVDADARLDPDSKFGAGELHRGFLSQMNAILPEVKEAMNKILEDHSDNPPSVMINGHSLGGALAVLFCSHCLQEGVDVASTYTFGQPKVGDEDFIADLEKRLSDAGCGLYRYVNNSDIVPKIPPNCDHGGTEVYIDRFGELTHADDADGLDRIADTIAGAGNVLDDHRCKFYLGLTRKNRTSDVKYSAPTAQAPAVPERDQKIG